MHPEKEPSRADLLVILAVAVAIGALLLSLALGGVYMYQRHNAVQQEQLARQQGELLEQKLCTSFSRLADLKPPAGNPATNPSRAYLQQQHTALDTLGTDLGCTKLGGSR